jgi:uroporphyrinogen decarboxylase
MTGRERFLAACAGRPVDATPTWFMRQAGGSMPRYLALRRQHSVLDIAKSPELCAEVGASAAVAIGADAAVMFADIMLPVEAMGVALELHDDGPRIERPVRTPADLARLRRIDASSDLGFVLEAIGRTRRELEDRVAVVGVAGGPFTLAAYLIEGGPSRDRLAARRLMHAMPEVWASLLDALTDATVDYVGAQAAAGADAIQVFDSWAGVLPPADYERSVAPWSRRILATITGAGAVAIHYVAAGAGLLECISEGATVVGIDAAQSLAAARTKLGDTAVQGNLDPARLSAGWSTLSAGIDAVLAENGGRSGHVFNTGHAVPPDTSPRVLGDVIDAVHQRTARSAALTEVGA